MAWLFFKTKETIMKVKMLEDHPFLEQIREGDRSYTERVMLLAGDIYESPSASEMVDSGHAEEVVEKVVEPQEKKVVEPQEKKAKKSKGK